MNQIALFRSCLRKEYRDQVIKMLRAVPGEYTRTSYRFQWIEPEVLSMIGNREEMTFTSFLVDPQMAHAIPCRQMTLVEPPIRDEQIGMYRFVFQLGDFVKIEDDFNTELTNWEVSEGATPPNSFVTRLNSTWTKIETLDYEHSLETWKKSISFLTKTWPNFDNTVFFRPQGDEYEATPHGPIRHALQSEDIVFRFSSFNPHLDDEDLSHRSIHVSIGDVMGDVHSVSPLPRDGSFDVSLQFLEHGQAAVQIEIRPDEQFSAYVPLTVKVDHNTSVDPSGPRVLGPAWSQFLEECARRAVADPLGISELFERLEMVFPGDHELAIQKGRLHYTQKNFAAARDQFTKAMNLRADSRSVWWSLFCALLTDDSRHAEVLMNRLDLSKTDLFDEAVALMPLLTDATVEWFAELPTIAFSEDKAIRMLLGMLEAKRGEPASCAAIKAIATTNAVAAINQARPLLDAHPEWQTMRLLTVEIARGKQLFEHVEEDVELLLNYAGEPIDEFVSTVTAIKGLVHPQRLPGLLMTSSIRLASIGESEALKAAMLFAFTAAEQAAANGDFISAQNALQFLEVNIGESEVRNQNYRPQIDLIISRMTRAFQRNPQLGELEDAYFAELAIEIKPDYEGRRVVVFGGTGREDSVLNKWSESLGLESFHWITRDISSPPDSNRLMSVVDDKTTLIVMSLDDSFITSSVRQWLRTKKIPQMRAMETRTSIFNALRALSPSAPSTDEFIPESCADALSWAQAHLTYLYFSDGVADEIDELDTSKDAAKFARRIKKDLEMLNKYAVQRLEQRARNMAFYNWAQLEGYNQNNLSIHESEGTDNRGKLRGQRTFKVPREADSTGEMYMPSHTKLHGDKAARIHFSTDTLKTIKLVTIGYIGPHLDLESTN